MRKISIGSIVAMVMFVNTVTNGLEARGQQNDLYSSVRASTAFSDSVVSPGQTPSVVSGNETSKSSPISTVPWVETSPAVGSPPTADSSSLVPDISGGTLHGRWVARRSATEAFAILLSADSTFVLVSVINGRQSHSSGKFSLQNNQLTMEDSSGIRAVGSVRLLSPSEFQFTPQTAGNSGTSLSFRKAP